MSGGPFRELFVEVPIALLEAAVIEARQRQPAPVPPTVSRWRLDLDKVLGSAILTRNGWISFSWQRSEHDTITELVAELRCGHRMRYRIPDQVFAAARPGELVDAIDRATDATLRRCFCVQRE